MKEHVEKLYSNMELYNSKLKTLCYEAAFEEYIYINRLHLSYLKNKIYTYDKPEKALSRVSKHFVNIIKAKYSSQANSLPPDDIQNQLNIFTAYYVLPAMLSMDNSSMKHLSEEICWYWRKSFKKSNIICHTFQHNSEYLEKHISIKPSPQRIDVEKALQL